MILTLLGENGDLLDSSLIEEIPSATKFANNDLGWYITDWADLYHPKGIYGNIDNIVDSKTLLYAGETIMEQIAAELKITLHEDPVIALSFLDKMRARDRDKLIMIIGELERYVQDCDYTSAWDFLRGAPAKFTDWLPSKINEIYKYAELATFFYRVGEKQYNIKWTQ